MTNVPIHDMETAPIGSRDPLARQAERVGRVLNIFGAMADSPVLMEMYDIVETHLARNSNLDNATRKAIHLTVAAVDNRGSGDGSVWQGAVSAGWTLEEILDAYAEVVRTILTNYFNHLVDTELDLPEVPTISIRPV